MASPTTAGRSTGPDLDRLHDDLQAEYARLADKVSAFDQRLLTVKGWGVTLSLASLGLGFQQDHYGLFLVAAASGVAFWLVEATTKMHQIRFYPRMGDIEYIAYELFGVDDTRSGRVSSPLIDWGWHTAEARVLKKAPKGDPRTPKPWDEKSRDPMRPWRFPHVAFPHLVAVVMGTVLFVLGLLGVFGPI